MRAQPVGQGGEQKSELKLSPLGWYQSTCLGWVVPTRLPVELLAFTERGGKGRALLRGMLVPSPQRFTGDAFLPRAAVALPFLLFFWHWYYSCPQNPLPGKAYGGLLQEIVLFF